MGSDKFELHKEYRYSYMEENLPDSIYSYVEEYGPFVIGEHFRMYKDVEKDKVISFVLTGWAGQVIYKCIYKD